MNILHNYTFSEYEKEITAEIERLYGGNAVK